MEHLGSFFNLQPSQDQGFHRTLRVLPASTSGSGLSRDTCGPASSQVSRRVVIGHRGSSITQVRI
jgi:hypothetical protein